MQNIVKNPLVAGLIASAIVLIAKIIDNKFITKKSGTYKDYIKSTVFVGILVTILMYAVADYDMFPALEQAVPPMGGGGGVEMMQQPQPQSQAFMGGGGQTMMPSGIMREPF